MRSSSTASSASVSPKGTWTKSGISGSNGSRKAARPAAESENPV